MWSLRLIGAAILAAGITTVSFVGSAVADEGMPVSFYELVQEGEGVEITFDYDSIFADPGGTYALLLERTDVNGTHVLLDYESLNASDVVDTSPGSCLYGEDEEYCQDVDWCNDCDGDDVEECPGDCFYTHYYLYVDECVPPGSIEYYVTGHDSYWPDTAWITVEDVGQDCPIPPSPDPDAGSDANGGGDSGCSVSGVGDQLPFGALALFMLAVGLAAARLGRSKRHR